MRNDCTISQTDLTPLKKLRKGEKSMYRNRLITVLILAPLCLGSALMAGDDDDEKAGGKPSNVVYVNSNNPAHNAVIAYRRNPLTGALTEMSGSPFATGGKGFYNTNERLGPDDHDQELVATPDHKYLYAVNQGSGTIAAFRIQNDGSLKSVQGSPFPSGGMQPASIGMIEDGLIVANRGDQNPGGGGGTNVPNYAVFRMNGNGALELMSKLPLVPGSSPTQALVSPNGKLMFDTHLFEVPFDNTGFPPFIPPFSSVLHSYRIGDDGKLTPAGVANLPAPFPPFILGLQAHPKQKVIYVGLVVAGYLGAYTYDDSGAMTFVGAAAGSPNNGICWIAVSPDAKYVFTSDAITDHVDIFSIANPTQPQFVGTLDLGGPRKLVNFPTDATIWSTTPFQLQNSPDGRFLYVLNHEATTDDSAPAGNALHILKVNAGGNLTETAASPLIFPVSEVPAGAHPLGIVVF
jgi:DNA-binding beta-propeller fold protein YncE